MNGFPLLTLLTAVCAAALCVVLSCAAVNPTGFSEPDWTRQVAETRAEDLHAPHFRDGRYFAPWMPMPHKGILDLLKWKLFTRIDYTEEEETFLPRVVSDTTARLRAQEGEFILWIGHNTFLVRAGGAWWLTDPIFSARALVPSRVTPPGLGLQEINALEGELYILVSHNHYDHLDRASMEGLRRDATVIVPMGLKESVKAMNKDRVLEMDWWQETRLGEGSTLVCLPAQHWSRRITQGVNRTLWASYLLKTPSATLYFGGDSGYFKGFREIGRRYPGIDYAFLGTTAYHPRWFMHYPHMDIPEAVKAFEELGARFFVPTQWGTFRLGSEPAGLPGLELTRHIREKGLDRERFKILDIGGILPMDTAGDR
jgi:L-ascorbate metabolism protein UlaG (beta-lactamase superfamily)